MVSKSKVSSFDDIDFAPYARGRIGRTKVVGTTSSKIAWNINNFDVAPGQWHSAISQITSDLELARADPLAFPVFRVGDFNLPYDPTRNLRTRTQRHIGTPTRKTG